MEYKMIAIDMDGTLLDDDMNVSERTKKVLKMATEKGVHVVLATGRIFTSARYYAKLLELVTPIISCNGAYICEHHRENVLYEQPLSLSNFKKVVKIIEEEGLYYHFYDNENFYVKELNHSSLKYYRWNEKQKPENKINIEIIDNPFKLAEDKNLQMYKVVVIDSDKKKMNNLRKRLSENKDIEIVSSWHNNIEIMDKGVSKGNALKKLCESMNIDKSEVIAIGDNYNDVPMFEFAGVSVAMGNAEDEVKKKASYITDMNSNEGVAKIIEKLVLR